ncbi:MAG: DNA translocase FtsK 4TM domain-containing protein, partial [Sphingomonas sp.]
MASRARPALWRETVKAGAKRSGALMTATALLVATLLMAIALASYHSGDPSFDTAAGGPALNWLGTPGAWLADLAFMLLGLPVAMLLPVVAVIALRVWRDIPTGRWPLILLLALLGITLMATTFALFSDATILWLPAGAGGLVGMGGAAAIHAGIDMIGDPAAIRWTARGVAALTCIGGIALYAWCFVLDTGARPWRPSMPKRLRDERAAPEILVREQPRREPTPRPVAMPDARPGPMIAERNLAPSVVKPKAKQASFDLGDNSRLPPLDLLKPPPPAVGGPIDKQALERNARLLESVLDDFNVRGSIINVRPGPVVTMYELEPASGIKASRVISLADDIARNMSAVSARVATIPGRTVIGIELPNARRETVALQELIGSQSFEDQSASLPLVLGKNIAGDPVIADLAPMPHLLVAGTTGSGKSVGLNCMILSLLYRLKPDQCKMIM